MATVHVRLSLNFHIRVAKTVVQYEMSILLQHTIWLARVVIFVGC
jgi:hypothetical protein